MKNKGKTIINYSVIVLIVVMVYIFFITGIEKIIPTYQNNLQTHENNKNKEVKQTKDGEIEKYIEQLLATENENIESLSKNELEELLQNNTVSKLSKKFTQNRKVNQTNTAVLKLKDEKIGEIYNMSIAINSKNRQENYKMIFTKDMKNIYLAYYGYNQSLAEQGSIIKKENTSGIEDTNKIVEKLKRQLEEMGMKLSSPLEPDIMYWREYDISSTYIIEDTKNNLTLVYDIVQDRILRLTLGFDKIENITEEMNSQEGK